MRRLLHPEKGEQGERAPPDRHGQEREPDRRRGGEPEQLRLQDHDDVQGEQDAATQVPHGKSEPGDEVDFVLAGHLGQEGIVEDVGPGKAEDPHGVDKDGHLPMTLPDHAKGRRGQHAQIGKRQQEFLPGRPPVRHRAQERRHHGDREARKGVPEAQLGRARVHVRSGTPVGLEEYREEPRHHGGGESGIGPVVQGPAPDLFRVPHGHSQPGIRVRRYTIADDSGSV